MTTFFSNMRLTKRNTMLIIVMTPFNSSKELVQNTSFKSIYLNIDEKI